ncbi:glucosidase 2 subunit beta [Sitodiplosis mosellana]|uniref:glucosidase 2 subunit beta n=1 Tax=Sitodiplosis mosellana TaxID=263140 RepID=UPI002444CFEF|nr:glucosidase 2 subunit beta [Sitodiplosis mosellana]
MRKQWIKKENLYHKPFYKKKLQMTLLSVFIMAVVFFAYQLFYIKQLQTEVEHKPFRVPVQSNLQTKETTRRIIRGIRYKDYDLYNPVVRDTFFCIQTGKAVPLERLNDDYCDCEVDGSDEPETNACPNGVFYCTYQKRHLTGRGRDISIPSSHVNDGVCDCCDGSDEWLECNGKQTICQNTCANT